MQSPVMLVLIWGRIRDWRVLRSYEQPVFYFLKNMFSPKSMEQVCYDRTGTFRLNKIHSNYAFNTPELYSSGQEAQLSTPQLFSF